MEKIHFYR